MNAPTYWLDGLTVAVATCSAKNIASHLDSLVARHSLATNCTCLPGIVQFTRTILWANAGSGDITFPETSHVLELRRAEAYSLAVLEPEQMFKYFVGIYSAGSLFYGCFPCENAIKHSESGVDHPWENLGRSALICQLSHMHNTLQCT